MEKKYLGQIFTPKNIVNDVLNAANYKGVNILKKHIIDNSCGDGAFLIEIIKRYIKEYQKEYKTLNGVENDLKKYIHGIELDKEIYLNCLTNLNKLCQKYHLPNIDFDIINADALQIEEYNNKMDFVVGNPPYVRIHNLKDEKKVVKKFSFCKLGMVDLYLVFYEIGLKMLNRNGILCYITSNSFYNSVAGLKLRTLIREKQFMELIMDLGHYNPFNVNAYTTICKIVNNVQFDECQYFKYDVISGKAKKVANIDYDQLFINHDIVLSDNNAKYREILSYSIDNNLLVQVKNGFATLDDKIFIANEFPFLENQIDVIKGSTNEWKKCIYPYDNEGHLIKFNELDKEVQKYFLHYKKELLKHNGKDNTNWYAFGRTQALNDVQTKKISINTIIKDIDSIKLNEVAPGQGVYSSLYILTEIPFEKIKKLIYSEQFIAYIKILNKCKSGGYYTFSSRDLARYLNYFLEVKDE